MEQVEEEEEDDEEDAWADMELSAKGPRVFKSLPSGCCHSPSKNADN